MATRRDQLQSYQYLIQRVLAAFVMRETDPAQSPLRRGIGAVFGGIMITVLVGAGFGVYGILTKIGSDSWKSDGSVVIEKETGASYVYFDGRLHPALNYASALLASGTPARAVTRVGGNALADVPRGSAVGIAGAPDSLPGADRLLGLPWTVCAAPGRDDSGQPISTVTLAVSRAPAGGQLLGERGMLVEDPDAAEIYLVWRGQRHRIREPDTVIPALFGEVVSAPAGTAWLNALPAGADIGPVTVSDLDEPSTALPDREIGDLLVAETGSGQQHYLVLDDGLAPVTELQKDILVAQLSAQPEPVGIAEATNAPPSGGLEPPAAEVQPPPAPPPLVAPAGTDLLCAVTNDATTTPGVWVGGTLDGLENANPTGSASATGVSLTDRVLVPAGHLAVVRVIGAPDGGSGAFYLITDLGLRHAVPSAEVLQILGYQPDQAVDVPASLVTRIPPGATLDPAVAVQPVGLTTSP
jgi:type VII secretion protein EccB